ncbi:MAG: hypothetical protein EBV77_03145 [Gemmatimonadaceae bacterium]|nr:hypothetical protein [Gemmatimonadaceae bacterium]
MALTGLESSAVNVSPTATVLLHTFAPFANAKRVPAATVPDTGTAAAGAGVGAAGLGAGAGTALGRGAGLGAGAGAAAGAGPAAGAGVAGTSCNCGCTLSGCDVARSRPSAESLAGAPVSSLRPPQAANATNAAADSAVVRVARVERIY